MEKTSLSRSTTYRKIKEAELPASVPIGLRAISLARDGCITVV